MRIYVYSKAGTLSASGLFFIFQIILVLVIAYIGKIV